VAWLTSAGSGWLSGAVLRVDGNTVHRVQGWQVDARAGYRSRAGERLDAGELDRGLRGAFGVLPTGLPSSNGPG
jgi:hypothetical protein